MTPPLFKYVKRQYAELLVNHGQVLLSPPARFRSTLVFGSEIGDEEEAISKVTADNLHIRGLAPEALRDGIVGPVKISAKRYERSRISDDILIYSTSYVYERSLMKDFDADTCVEIFDPPSFAKCISNRLKDFEYIGAEKCVYGEKINDYMNPNALVPNYLLKHHSYAHQDEVRFIWKKKNSTKVSETKLLTCSGIGQYCRIKV